MAGMGGLIASHQHVISLWHPASGGTKQADFTSLFDTLCPICCRAAFVHEDIEIKASRLAINGPHRVDRPHKGLVALWPNGSSGFVEIGPDGLHTMLLGIDQPEMHAIFKKSARYPLRSMSHTHEDVVDPSLADNRSRAEVWRAERKGHVPRPFGDEIRFHQVGVNALLEIVEGLVIAR